MQRKGPVDAIIFDMDGTLIQSHHVTTAAYRAAIVAGGGIEPTTEEIIAAYSLGPPSALLSHLLGRPALDADVDRYHSNLATDGHRVLVYDGIAQLLSDVADRLPIGLFTGASRRAAGILLSSVGLHKHFLAVAGGDEVRKPKPDPEGIYLVCRRLGIETERIAYVGDSPLDLEAARRSGALAVGAAWGHLFNQSASADLIVNHPRDLLALVAP